MVTVRNTFFLNEYLMYELHHVEEVKKKESCAEKERWLLDVLVQKKKTNLTKVKEQEKRIKKTKFYLI